MENKNHSVLGFYVKMPSNLELAFLAGALLLTLATFIIQKGSRDAVSIAGISFVFLWFTPLVSPLGDSLRNVIFLVVWTLSCVLLFLSHPSVNPNLFPFFSIVYVQIARIFFNLIYKKEPVQVFTNYGIGSPRFSKIENRQADKKDFYYSLIVACGGLLLTMLLAH